MAEEDTPTTEQPNMSLLAKQRFGPDFHGEVKEEIEEPEAPEEPETPEEPEEPEEEPESPEEPEEGPGEEPEEPEKPEEPEHQEYELPQVAQMLGVEEDQLDVDDDGRVVLQGKVDGEPVRMSVKEYLDKFQMLSAADKRLEEAKSKREELLTEAEKRSTELNEQWTVAANMIERAEKLLDQDMGEIDWKALREDDPAEYSAKKAEIADRRQQIENMKTEARQAYQQSVQQQQVQSKEQLQEFLAKEQEALLSKLPEWQDDAKAKAEKTQLVGYLKDEGFEENEISNAMDHRLILLARKAMLYDQGQKKVDTAKKKVAKVPKVVKPGASKPADQVNKQKIDKAKQRLSKSGNIDDAFALLRARRQA